MMKLLLSWKILTKNSLLAFILILASLESYASKRDVSLTPKREAYHFKRIEDNLGSIVPMLTHQGFIFKDVTINFKEECSQYERFFFKVMALLSKNKPDQKKGVLEVLNRCPNANDLYLRTLLQIERNDLKSEESFRKFLNKYVSNKREHNKILKQYLIKQKMRERSKVLPIFNELVSGFGKEKEFYTRHIELLAKLKTLPPSSVNDFAQMIIAIKSNNRGWLKTLYDRIVKKNLHSLIFEIEDYFFQTDAQTRRFYERLGTFREIIEDNIEDDTLGNMLIRLIDELFPTFIESSASVKWSLQEIRDLSSRHRYGKRFVWFWFTRLYSRSNEVEAISFLKKRLDYDLVISEGEVIAPIFQYFFPIDNKTRKASLKVISRLSQSKDNYDRYVLLQLLRNKVLKRELTRKYPRLRRTMVTLERSFYRDLISSGVAINFSIYNLFLLGDFDEKLLWWLVI